MTRRSFWAVATAMALATALHYLVPSLPISRTVTFLNRHAVDRILFLVPIAGAAFYFGRLSGLLTLALALLIMIPRVIWISSYPADAALEVAAVGAIGLLVIWIIEIQEREKKGRQATLEKMEIASAIASTTSQSLNLDEILEKGLEKVLEGGRALGLLTPEPKGSIFLLGPGRQHLHLKTSRGLAPEAATEVVEALKVGPWSELREVICREAPKEPDGPFVLVPLKARERVLGVMLLGLRRGRWLGEDERQLLTSIGGQIGMAIENARLYEAMHFYVRQITRAQENERKRIAQELHDETVQMLIAISRRLEALMRTPQEWPQLLPRLQQLREMVQGTVQNLRRCVQDLRPPVLDDLGLVAGLRALMDDLMEAGETELELSVVGEPYPLSSEEELTLFRIAQEALNNVYRHARASRAWVELEFRLGAVRMTVRDNGCGFNAPERMEEYLASGRLGLVGILERARLLGGTLLIQSAPGSGTTVVVDVPVEGHARPSSGTPA